MHEAFLSLAFIFFSWPFVAGGYYMFLMRSLAWSAHTIYQKTILILTMDFIHSEQHKFFFSAFLLLITISLRVSCFEVKSYTRGSFIILFNCFTIWFFHFSLHSFSEHSSFMLIFRRDEPHASNFLSVAVQLTADDV